MPLPATRYATITPINPTATVAGVRYRLVLTDIAELAGFWADAQATDKERGRSYDDASEAGYACRWLVYDHAAKHAEVIVYVPSVLASGAPKLRVYPPVAANAVVPDTDPLGADACYPDALAAPVDGLSDASGNGRDFVAEVGEGITTAPGKVGDAVKFPNISSYAAHDAGAGGVAGFPLTAMAWIKADDWASSSQQYFLGIGSVVNMATSPHVKLQSRGSSFYRLEYDDGVGAARIDGGTLSAGWQHVALVVTASSITAYVDAVSIGSTAHTLTAPSLRYLLLGNDGGGWQGLVDEAHFLDIAPTGAWIAYYYAMTNDPASFYSAWATEGAATAPVLSAAYDGSPLAAGGQIALGTLITRSDTPGQVVVTVTNGGDADITSIVVTASGDASDTASGTLGSSLAPGASGTIVLAMDYTTRGGVEGGCSIASSDGASPLAFTLAGTVDPNTGEPMSVSCNTITRTLGPARLNIARVEDRVVFRLDQSSRPNPVGGRVIVTKGPGWTTPPIKVRKRVGLALVEMGVTVSIAAPSGPGAIATLTSADLAGSPEIVIGCDSVEAGASAMIELELEYGVGEGQ